MTEKQWSPDQEVELLRALCKFKPVGIRKHFHMISILRLMNYKDVGIGKDGDGFEKDEGNDEEKSTEQNENGVITARQIWHRLGELYDLEGLDELDDDDSDSEDEEEEEAEEDKIKKEAEQNQTKNEDGVKDRRKELRLKDMEVFELPFEVFGDLMVSRAKTNNAADIQDDDLTRSATVSPANSNAANEKEKEEEGEEEEEEEYDDDDDAKTGDDGGEESQDDEAETSPGGSGDEDDDQEGGSAEEEDGDDDDGENEEEEEGEEEGKLEEPPKRKRGRPAKSQPVAVPSPKKPRVTTISPTRASRRLRTRGADSEEKESAGKAKTKKVANVPDKTKSKTVTTRSKSQQPRRSSRRKLGI